MTKTNTSNIAFIDGQNMHLGTTQDNWKVDLKKLRIYLKDKYHIIDAYYFLGYASEDEQDLYSNLQKSGFVVLFKEHNPTLKSMKRGNVDTDIVFEIMKNIIDNNNFDKIVIISGDGDYKKVVDYLIKKDRFKKILFPNKHFASSLYKHFGAEFFDYLYNIKTYIEWHKKEKGS
ncbi:MAG: NYN domain-containing protein [Candidatus Pacebacteria bacterium]|nr:NYN domain-containing protein [Candidatus Paceibacterota bacterium]